MDRLKFATLLLLCLCSCSKFAETPEYKPGPDDLLVSIADQNAATKTILSDNVKTKFVSGDKIKVVDSAGKSAVYKYRAVSGGKYVFQKDTITSVCDAGFDKENFACAFYPADSVKSFTKTSFTANMGAVQSYLEGSFPVGSAPLACFKKTGDDIKFTNCFGIVRLGFQYDSIPAAPLLIDTLLLTSTSSMLSGKFKFSQEGEGYSIKVETAGNNTKTVKLKGCPAAEALSDATKYFYLAVPGVSDNETMTITVKPTTDIRFSGKFTANTSGKNIIKQNYILQMDPFKLKTLVSGERILDDWTVVDTIQVGQITLSTSEVTVSKSDGEQKVQINGVSEWDKINTMYMDESYKDIFGADTTSLVDNDTRKYYIKITGKAVGTGKLYVNDEVTNSGSYINVTVN